MNVFLKLKDALRRYDDSHNFTCDVCGREVFGGERVCGQCNKTLPHNDGAICPLCGRRVAEAGVCLECKQKPLVSDRARSAFVHEGEAARLVYRFKNGAQYLYRTFADYLTTIAEREFGEAELVTYVPMTKRARKKRGYNQSFLVAEEIARRTGLTLFTGLEKVRDTKAQKTLMRAERETNLEGCFRVTDKKAVVGKRVLIVDDTLTTGATTSALASRLKRAKAKEIFVITMTSVQYKNPFGELPEKKKRKKKVKF